ncbi:hypothetical protein Tco_0871592, partial [Tanacetum coccineum]
MDWLARSDRYASIVASEQRAKLFNRIGTLERDNMRLRGMLGVERQRVDRLRRRSGYHQKDRKPSQNDKTEHGMDLVCRDISLGRKVEEKPNRIFLKTKTKWALNQFTTAHLCAIDKDCEDFEGPILAQLQPISAI